MADASWKAWERRIAKWFQGQRRGADYADRYSQAGKNDIIVDGFSIEAKLYKRPSYGMIKKAIRQAEAAKEDPNDIAVAIIKKKYDLDEDAIMAMSPKEFLDHFGPVGKDE